MTTEMLILIYVSVYKFTFILKKSLNSIKKIMNNLVISFNKSGVETFHVSMTKIPEIFDTKLAVTFDLLVSEQK